MAGGSRIHSPSIFLLLLLLLCCLITMAHSTRLSLHKLVDGRNKDEYNCVYTIYVRTGTIWKGGTDSIISLAIAGVDGDGVLIEDLESWGGLMGDGYDYFERGNLDIFSGRGPCISSWPPCWMNLTSDGSGPGHGWYCNYVEVTTTGPHLGCNQQLFTVEQWLARDASPYQLYAIRDLCSRSNSGDGDDEGGEEIATITKGEKKHVTVA
ncbi:PLAT domain-containing protein 1-like [Zingiber officinale]|uniref:PLAT domain-containing protein 1-like n=1 Tax=Zingiber officinale TaxID=94328 RepID=UPI001C4D491B|nr:PLAT domain-containing protein 1-like [Zingiber officinale]